MKKTLLETLDAENESKEIDLAPLLDVVFILLIFFIVTSVFVVETGVDVDKPSASSSSRQERSIVLIAITQDEQVVYGGANIGVDGVRNKISAEMRRDIRPVIIQADKKVSTDTLVKVLDQIKLGGAKSVSIATIEP